MLLQALAVPAQWALNTTTTERRPAYRCSAPISPWHLQILSVRRQQPAQRSGRQSPAQSASTQPANAAARNQGAGGNHSIPGWRRRNHAPPLRREEQQSVNDLSSAPDASSGAELETDAFSPDQTALSAAMALLLSVALALTPAAGPPAAAALTAPSSSYSELSRQHYGHPHRGAAGSALPNAREAETIAALDRVLHLPQCLRENVQIPITKRLKFCLRQVSPS